MLIIGNQMNLTGTEKCHLVFAIFLMIWFYGMVPIGILTVPPIMALMVAAYFMYVAHACC